MEDSPDRAVQDLESFRRALVRLMREALRHEPGCVATDQPYVDVTVEAGEECGEPRWKIDAHVRIEESGPCTLRVGVDEAESDVSVFKTPEEALAAVKAVLDRETARWTTFVSFKRKRPGRR